MKILAPLFLFEETKLSILGSIFYQVSLASVRTPIL